MKVVTEPTNYLAVIFAHIHPLPRAETFCVASWSQLWAGSQETHFIFRLIYFTLLKQTRKQFYFKHRKEDPGKAVPVKHKTVNLIAFFLAQFKASLQNYQTASAHKAYFSL